MSASTVTAPARIHPDSPILVKGVVAAVGVLAVASFAAGVPGLIDVAEWAGLPVPLRWAVPVILDGAMLVYGAVAVVQRARQERALFAWGVLALLTVASMGAQVAHVLGGAQGRGWQTLVGAGLAASFPLLVFASTHTALSVAVAPAPTRKRRRAAATTANAATRTVPARPASASPTPAPVAPVAPVAAVPAAPARVVGVGARERAVALAASGMSQRQIAEALGVGKTTVGRWISAPEAA